MKNIEHHKGKERTVWWQTTTTIWRIDETKRRHVRDYKRMLGETGHTGARTEAGRKDHDSIYTGTHSIFPGPLCERILLRYGGHIGNRIIDPFAGGAIRGIVASVMGYDYVGYEIRPGQIEENLKALKELGLSARYVLGNGCLLDGDVGTFDFAYTCPPYYNLEKYSDLEGDLSNLPNYEQFNLRMSICAVNLYRRLKPGAFCCIVVGPFRDKSGELVDFRAHTVENFRGAKFTFWQEIILIKNSGSAAKRAANAWKGTKLVPAHEYLLVFRKPEKYVSKIGFAYVTATPSVPAPAYVSRKPRTRSPPTLNIQRSNRFSAKPSRYLKIGLYFNEGMVLKVRPSIRTIESSNLSLESKPLR